jgi:hypothetical protein
MNGGEIKINTASGNCGGGVFVEDYGNFTMKDGSITGNNAANNCGGVFVASNGTFTMKDNAVAGTGLTGSIKGNFDGTSSTEPNVFISVGGNINGDAFTVGDPLLGGW